MAFTALSFASLEVLSSTKMTQLYGNTYYFQAEAATPSGAWAPTGAWVPSGNWGPTGAWTFAPGSAIIPVTVDQNQNQIGLKIDSESADYDALQVYGKRGVYIAQDLSGGRALYATRNIAEAGSNPLATFYEANASCTQDVVYIANDGLGSALKIWSTVDVGLGVYPLHVFANKEGDVALFFNDGDNVNRRGIKIQSGTDDNSGTNYHALFTDGDGSSLGDGISSSGGVVTYNAFSGGHPSIERSDKKHPLGYVMSSTEVFHDLGFAKMHPESESHKYERIVEPSKIAYDKKVFGVYVGSMGKGKNHQIYGLGNSYILVCDEGGNIQRGDFITTSNKVGHGMKQDDDILHNYTIAKSEEDVDWSKESKKKKLIACTLHAS